MVCYRSCGLVFGYLLDVCGLVDLFIWLLFLSVQVWFVWFGFGGLADFLVAFSCVVCCLYSLNLGVFLFW